MMREQRRLSVIMFTDMVGYTKCMAEDEHHALALLDEHNALLERYVDEHGGTVLKHIGDAVMAEFTSAISAVECAVGVQKALQERNEGMAEKDQIVIRVGMHLGDVILREGDVFGDGVNIASRLEPLAQPGGICVSRVIFDTVRRALKLSAISLGNKDLKNVGEAIEVFRVLLDEEDIARHAEEEIVRHDDPRMRTIVVPFWGSTPEETAEGRKMAALVVRALEKELPGDDVQIAFDDKAEIKTNAEALGLGRERRADAVIWGEVVLLYGEVEIQPRLTWCKHSHFAATRVGALATTTAEEGQIALRRAKADEVANAALLMAALHHQALGSLDDAVELYRRLLEKAGAAPAAAEETDLPMAYDRLWWCYLLQHKVVEALSTAQEGVARYPKQAGLRANLGICLLRVGRTEEGVKELQEAARLDPESGHTRSRLAFGYMKLGRYREAIDLAQEAIRLDARDGFARSHLGGAFLVAGRLEDAIREFREAVKLEPENHEHRRWLGVALVSQTLTGEPGKRETPGLKEAAASLTEACRLAPLDRYNPLVLRAVDLLRGEAGDDRESAAHEAAESVIASTGGGWPAPVFQLFAGELPEADLFAVAREETDAASRRSRETEAHFYVAVARFAAGDGPGMREHLEACSPENMFEDLAGRGILNALPQTGTLPTSQEEA